MLLLFLCVCDCCRARKLKYIYIYIYIYIYGVKGVWIQLLGGQGTHACVILVLWECIWNAPVVLLVLPAFDDTGSLGSLPRQVVYPSG